MCRRMYSCQAEAADQNFLTKNSNLFVDDYFKKLCLPCVNNFSLHPFSASLHKKILQDALSRSPGGQGRGGHIKEMEMLDRKF